MLAQLKELMCGFIGRIGKAVVGSLNIAQTLQKKRASCKQASTDCGILDRLSVATELSKSLQQGNSWLCNHRQHVQDATIGSVAETVAKCVI